MAVQQSARMHARIGELSLCEELGRGASSTVYRALSDDGGEYTVKISHRTVREEREQLLEFRREASVLAGLSHRGLPSAHEVGETEEGYAYFVMDLARGETLASRLQSGALSSEQARRLGIDLAEILAVVHARGLVHQDVKPSNILVSAELAPTLVDFGLAARARADNDNRTVGTFLYSAPEQTGLLKRAIDGRADLYALGVVLYECVTGAPPFQAEDAAELLRLHATQKPKPIKEHARGVDLELAQIIERLLSKDPDDRYPSAEELRADLERAGVARVSSSLRPVSLRPSTHASVTWVGRAAAVDELNRVLTARPGRTGSAALVRGAAGIGKSRLSEEVEAHALGVGIAAVRVSCTGGAALEAIHALLAAIQLTLAKAEPSADLAASIREAAGDLSAYVLRVFPQLAEILRRGHDATASDSGLDPSLFYEAAARFLCNLSARAGQMLWIVDDAQWLDLSSCKVLGSVARQVDRAPVHLLCLVQPHELSVQTRVERELSNSLDAQVTLGELDQADLGKLAVGHLGGGVLSDELAHELALRAAGNPLTLREYLRAMLDAGVLWPSWGVWKVDRAGLSELALPDDVSDLLLARLDHASEETRNVLRVAATIGPEFRPSELSRLCELPEAVLDGALEEALRVRLLDRPAPDLCRFVHELVRERFAAQVREEERPRLRRRIAQVLQARGQLDDATLFTSAEHALAGVDADSAADTFALGLRAAERALACFASEQAGSLFARLEALSTRYSLPPSYELFRGLSTSLAQCGQLPESIPWLQRAIESCPDRIERAELHLRVSEAEFFGRNDLKAMHAALVRGWRDLGRTFPEAGVGAVFAFIFYTLLFLFIDATRIGFGGTRDRRAAVVLRRLGERTALYGLLTCQVSLMMRCGGLANFTGLRLGVSSELAFTYGSFGAGLVGLGLPASVNEKYGRKAQAMANQVGDPVARARARHLYIAGLHYMGEMVEGEQRVEQLMATDSHVLPAADTATVFLELCLGLVQRGHTQRVRKAVERGSMLLRAAGPGGEREAIALAGQLVLAAAIEGKTVEAHELNERIKVPVHEEDAFQWFVASTSELWTSFEAHDLARCDELLQRKFAFKPATASWHMAYHWVLKCHVRYRQLQLADETQRAACLERFRQALAELKAAGRHPMQRGHVLMFSAYDLHARGKSAQALLKLNEAEDVARTHDVPWVLFECKLVRASVLSELGREVASDGEAESALWLAQAHGWSKRAERARQRISSHRRTATARSIDASGSISTQTGRAAMTVARTRTHAAALTATRDRAALLEVSLATAEELDPKVQAQVALDKLLQVLGAERALFYAWNESEKRLVRIAARDAEGHDLPADVRVATSLVERVRREQAPLVLHGTDEGAALGSQSVVAENVRSMICAPVLLRDELLGVVYLDSRLAKGVFTRADLDILLGIANHVAIGQQMARAAQRELERRALERDLELTAAVQMLLLPKQPDVDFGHLKMVSLYRPASRSGGDFWGYETLPDGSVRIFLGDVTGHGAGAAMVTSAMAGCHRALSRGRTPVSVETLFSEMDRVLSSICDGSYAMTFSVLEVARDTSRVRWWSAGAPPILHVPHGRKVTAKPSTGTPLRCGELTIPQLTLELDPGDRLLLFSDAVCEQSMANGKPVGLRRLMELLDEHRGASVEQTRDALWAKLSELRAHREQEDDVTVVLLERLRVPG